MVPKDDARKVAIRCGNCGEVSAAEIFPDGTITPLGQPEPCQCEDTDVEVLEAADVFEDSVEDFEPR